MRTKVIEVDFTAGAEIYDAIEKELIGLDVSVLVNNVGMSYPNPEYFLDMPDGSKVSAAAIAAVTGLRPEGRQPNARGGPAALGAVGHCGATATNRSQAAVSLRLCCLPTRCSRTSFAVTSTR